MESKLVETFEEQCSIFGSIEADVNVKDENGDTPLHLAAKVANVDSIKYLITQGADVNVKNSKTGRSPLHCLMMYAADQKFDGKELFEVEADALEVLLSADADVNAVEITGGRLQGNTPLHYFFNTYLYGHNDYNNSFFKIVKIFLKHRADFQIKNRYGLTPMDVCLRNCHHFENLNIYPIILLETFIKYGIIDVENLFTQRPKYGETILHDSCSLLNYNMIKFLVNCGANIDIVDEDGESPLIELVRGLIDDRDCTSKNPKILDYFLGLNPDVNVISNYGLHILNYDDDYFISEYPKFLWKALIGYIAKKQSTGYLLHVDIAQTISYDTYYGYQSYLDKCTEELKSLQELKFPWVNLYDILMDHEKKLDCYAKNKELVQEFNELLLAQKYPIYGPSIVKRFSKALQKQEVMEKSAVILSSCLPCHLDPSHLVIWKILSYLKGKYLRFLCEPESEELQLKIKTEKELNEFRISLGEYVCNCYKIE